MRDLDKTKVYDLSELTSEERKILVYNEISISKNGFGNYVDLNNDSYKYLVFYSDKDYWSLRKEVNKNSSIVNAKELFYTLENVQVDCRELSKKHVEQMVDVFRKNGFSIEKHANKVDETGFILSSNQIMKDNSFGFYNNDEEESNEYPITYEKFMELFGNKEKSEGFNNLVEVLNEELTEEYNNSQFKQIANSLADLLEYKNKMYGNSALEPLNIFNNKCKVGQRLDDKLARIKNSNELRKNDICDLIGYLILTCKENNWTNFDEFKD